MALSFSAIGFFNSLRDAYATILYMLIHVKVHADSKSEKIELIRQNSYSVHVREKAENNAANRRVVEVLSLHLSVISSKMRIVTGHHSPSKIIEIQD